MQHVISTRKIHLSGHDSYSTTTSLPRLTSIFSAWCNTQEKNRFLWLAASLVGGIAAVLPLTLMAIVLAADNNFTLWIAACIVNVPILVVNLAVQPTKLILPVLFSAWTVDAIIITGCLLYFFMK